MPKAEYTSRTIGLTQKAMTELCNLCGGMGCVLAIPVVREQIPRYFPEHRDYPNGRARADEALEVLIPCPGCFNDAALLTTGL